jgi:hypothetical protein
MLQLSNSSLKEWSVSERTEIFVWKFNVPADYNSRSTCRWKTDLEVSILSVSDFLAGIHTLTESRMDGKLVLLLKRWWGIRHQDAARLQECSVNDSAKRFPMAQGTKFSSDSLTCVRRTGRCNGDPGDGSGLVRRSTIAVYKTKSLLSVSGERRHSAEWKPWIELYSVKYWK